MATSNARVSALSIASPSRDAAPATSQPICSSRSCSSIVTMYSSSTTRTRRPASSDCMGYSPLTCFMRHCDRAGVHDGALRPQLVERRREGAAHAVRLERELRGAAKILRKAVLDQPRAEPAVLWLADRRPTALLPDEHEDRRH